MDKSKVGNCCEQNSIWNYLYCDIPLLKFIFIHLAAQTRNIYSKNIPPELLWRNLYLKTVVNKTIYGIIFNCDFPLLKVIFFHVVLFSAKTQNINNTTYIVKIYRLYYCGEIYIWKLFWTKLYMELFLLWLCTFKVCFHPSRFSIFCQSTQHIYYNTYCKNTPYKLLWTKL